jgi:ABC-type transporter Mla subunit MlaD
MINTGGDLLSLINSGNGIIGIDYAEMNRVKSNLKRARDKSTELNRRINAAITKLQVDKNSSRIKMATDQLRDYSRQVTRMQGDMDRTINKVDKAIRRFKEVDSACAARIRAIGGDESEKKSLFEELEGEFTAIGERIEGTASSLIKEGEKIFNSVRNDEEKAFNGMKKEAGNICSGIQDVIKNGRIKEIASDSGVMASLMYLEATSTDKNFLKKAPDLVKVYENKLLVDGNNIWSTYSKEDEVGSGLIKNLYKDAVNIENKVGSVADTGWEEYKKINPIGAGIIAGTYDFGKGTIEGLVGVGKGIGNEYYDLRENPEGTIKNLARVGIDIAALVNPTMPKTEDDERFEKGLEGIINKEINDKLINGDTYTRSRAITDIGENIVSLFLGGAEIKAASKVGEIGDLGKLADVSETGEKIDEISKVSKISDGISGVESGSLLSEGEKAFASLRDVGNNISNSAKTIKDIITGEKIITREVLDTGTGLRVPYISVKDNNIKRISKIENVSGSSLEVGSKASEDDFKSIQELVNESTCNNDELYNYLLKNVDSNAANAFLKEGVWPERIQIPKNSSVLNADGSINWSKAAEGGYTLNTDGTAIKEDFIPKIGEVIDRYGNANGRYTSPIIDGKSYSYTERSLPYMEDLSNYHQYEVTGDFSKIEEYVNNCSDVKLKTQIDANVTKYYDGDFSKLISYKGEIAEIKGWGNGGGTQYEFALTVDQLERLGLLKEIK